MREGNRLRVDFAYAPERVTSIKGISGYRYHADDKSWSIPLASLESFCTLTSFPANRILNGLSSQSTVAALAPSQAHSVVRDNPFCVSEDALAATTFDLVVRLQPGKQRLRLVPRFNSKVFKILDKNPAALFARFEQSFSFPVVQLAALLKELRDKGLAFAIDAQAGETLASSAVVRQQLLAGSMPKTADALSAALLTPFITKQHGAHSGVTYRPCFFTAEQFTAAFPGASRKKSDAPFVLDEVGLLAFAARRTSIPFPIYLTEEVEQELALRRDELKSQFASCQGPLNDDVAEVLELPLVWRVLPSGRGALVINLPPTDATRVVLTTRLAELLDAAYPSESVAVTVEIPDSQLIACVQEVVHALATLGCAQIPASKSFLALQRDIEERVQARTHCAYYTSSSDIAADAITGLERAAAERLFPHQRVAVEWLLKTPYAFLGDDMGLGKTLSVLSYFSALVAQQKFELLLVICPNSLTRNWAREAAQWFSSLRSLTLTGDRDDKSWALRLLNDRSVDYQVLIVNYEGVRLDYITPELERLASERKTLLCLDESQRVKNPTSKTFKALSSIAPKAERRVLLSGTPTPKDVTDLWAQLRLLDGGKRFGKSYYKWLSSIAELGNEFSEYAVKSFNQEAVQEAVLRVHELMLRRRKEKVVHLPAKTFLVREVELTGNQRDRYDEIREGLILRMRASSGEQFVREITNILEEYLRAVQVASNPRLIDPEWKGEPAKFLELDEIVDEVVREGGQKIVVWTNYLGNVRELAERYKDLGTAQFSGEISPAEREATVRAFQQSDSPRILIAVPAAGGVGITLTAAQTAVYIDKTWNAEHWMQSVDRIHRIGQQGTVNIISLLGCKVDEIVHWNLRRKEQAQAEVLGDVKSRNILKNSVSREELLAALEIT
jgi:superfamily II DNA or RNA helicase